MHSIVFTDLDGTLLDHHGYSWAAAGPALARLAELRIPVVFVTSKTRAEVEMLQRQIGVDAPFVVENGGGVFFPPGAAGWPLDGARPCDRYRLVCLGRPYREIRGFVETARRRHGIRGFGDLSDAEVAELTGLDLRQARCARAREFSEPILLERPDAIDLLEAEARAKGFALTRGGRFRHVIGAGQDKGRAARIVAEAYEASRPAGATVRTIGLGDSPNDAPMLDVVDIAVVIPGPDGDVLEPARDDAVVAPYAGSRGWNTTVLEILRSEHARVGQSPTSGTVLTSSM